MGEAPFDSGRKMMSTVHKAVDGYVQFTKGGPDVVLERCTGYWDNGMVRPMTEEKRAEILAANKAMADKALRVLAAEGDAVKTAAAGEVTSVTRDELMGTTVCITHSGGYVTRYSSLQENPPISQGQQLKAGDIVGYVGTAAAEATMGPHLHFAVEKDGSLIDPKEYIK